MFPWVTTFQKYPAGLWPVLSHVPCQSSEYYQCVEKSDLCCIRRYVLVLGGVFAWCPTWCITFRRRLSRSCIPCCHLEMSSWRRRWKNRIVISSILCCGGSMAWAFEPGSGFQSPCFQFSNVTFTNLGLSGTSRRLWCIPVLPACGFYQLCASHLPLSLCLNLISWPLSYQEMWIILNSFFFQSYIRFINFHFFFFLRKFKQKDRTKILVGQGGGWWLWNWMKKCHFWFAKTLQFVFAVAWFSLSLNDGVSTNEGDVSPHVKMQQINSIMEQ